MTSVQLDSLILAYFSGSVGEAELARLDQILKADESARERFAALAGQEIDLRDVVVERLAPLRMTRRRMVARLRLWAPLAAAASLMAILGWWALRGPDTGLAPAMAALTELRVEQTTGATRTDSERAQQTLRIGDLVRPGMTVETAAGQILALVGRDGMTRLDLAAGTRLEWRSADTASTSLHLARGELAARIGPQTPGHAWLFGTPHADIRVVGTQLRMLTESDQTRVDVDDGRVEVKSRQAETWTAVESGQTALVNREETELALLGEILFEDTFEQGLDRWIIQEEQEDDIMFKVEPDDPMVRAVRIGKARLAGAEISCLEINGLAAMNRTFNLKSKTVFPIEALAAEIEFTGTAIKADNIFSAGAAFDTPLDEVAAQQETIYYKPFRMRMNRWYVRRGAYRPSVDADQRLLVHTTNAQDGRRILEMRSLHGPAEGKSFHIHIRVRNMTLRVARVTVRRLLDTP